MFGMTPMIAMFLGWRAMSREPWAVSRELVMDLRFSIRNRIELFVAARLAIHSKGI